MSSYQDSLPVTVTGGSNSSSPISITYPGLGTWQYYSGISGTVVVSALERVIGIAAHSTAGGTVTINGGSAVTLPANVAIVIEPQGNLTAPTIVFTGTDTYFVEVVS